MDGKGLLYEQLFDLEHDPAEKTNLIETHGGSATLSDLRRLCQQASSDPNNRCAAYREMHQVTTR